MWPLKIQILQYIKSRSLSINLPFLWLQLTRPAQDLLMSLCMNCNTHGADDMEVISNLIKIRLKPKVLLNHYMLCVRSVKLFLLSHIYFVITVSNSH